MRMWIDAQLSPEIAHWMRQTFAVDAEALRDLGLREAEDSPIFWRAREASAVVMTKDADFIRLLGQHGPPPQVVWLRCGNTSNASLRAILTAAWPVALKALAAGEPLVEIRDAS